MIGVRNCGTLTRNCSFYFIAGCNWQSNCLRYSAATILHSANSNTMSIVSAFSSQPIFDATSSPLDEQAVKKIFRRIIIEERRLAEELDKDKL